MNAPAFTSGWRAERGETYVIRADDGGQIAIFNWLRGRYGMAGRRSDDEVTANLFVAAAAPDMHAVLATIMRLNHHEGLDAEGLRSLQRLAETALAKAEGRS